MKDKHKMDKLILTFFESLAYKVNKRRRYMTTDATATNLRFRKAYQILYEPHRLPLSNH